ncbi:VCBS repeat-containing protein [candidate division WOR-3 bacterium]|nr:VCBS repeat-containing protein [candidate division WOR-3 bacterium]
MGSMRSVAAALPLALACLVGLTPALTWRETSQGDFADGQLESNLLASFRFGGTVEFVPRFDLNNDGWMDLVCSEGYGSHVYVYFGDSSGFAPSRSRSYPVPGGAACDISDLNYDGYPDLIHMGWRARACGTIYWGTVAGPDPQKTTLLPVSNSEAVATADLDRDGYLDLVFASEDGTSYIYWGSSSGYSQSNTTQINLGAETGHNWVVADLDKDGYFDLLGCCTSYHSQQPIFYFGPNRTYRIEWLDYSAGGGFNAQGITVADLDHNDWLDIVYTGHNNITQTWVYWGSDSGFAFDRRTVLNTNRCFGGSAAYDFNQDDLLDLLFFRGSYYSPSQFKPIIYYNTGSSPYFSDSKSDTVGTLSMNSTGGRVADFDGDGNVDIYFDDFRPSTTAKVLWGPDWTETTELPCYSGHHGMARPIGNIYDRSYRENCVSSVFDGGATTNWHAVTWDDSTPGGSSVQVAVRTGAMATPDPTWSGWYALANGDTVPDSMNSRYMQYRSGLAYQNPASLPMLFEVRVDYGQPLMQDVGPAAILVPSGIVDSGVQVTPAVVVRNFGKQSAAFPTTIMIGSSYSQTLNDTLAAGAADTLRFPVWNAGPVGTQTIVCFTTLSSDENPGNDTLVDSVRVRRVFDLDVAPIKLLAPAGTVDSGTVHLPSVVVRNLGRTAAGFPVTMKLGAGYSVTVQETLVAGLSDTIVFPSWTAEPVGPVFITCYTALVGDQDPHNDTIGDTLTVLGPPEHDVGAVAILAPTGTVSSGDTVIPRARIRNYGNRVERFFDVRFRIGANYSRTANEARMLYPDSTVELAFPAWVAVSGTWAVSCSTMLSSDANRANDKAASTVRVFEQLLHIEPDQTDQLETGQGKTYQFCALIEGDTGGIVEVARPAAPAGWTARLCDVTGANDLTDTDADGIPDLGHVVPGETSRFSLEVMTPSGLAGDTGPFVQKIFVIAGHLGNDSLVADTALLNLNLVPAFSVHNFPNPFGGNTTFVIGLPADGKVSLTVYTRAGGRVCQILKSQDRSAGVHFEPWDAANDNGRRVAPGTYEYVLDFVHDGNTERLHKRLVVTGGRE